MLNLLIFGLALGILVTVHEGGHFLAAKLFGVYVEKFSIGFGPKLIGFKYKETEYRLSLLPLGGYVKMKAENPNEEKTNLPDEFTSKTWWQRLIIAFAGPFANLLLAILLFSLTFMAGKSYEDHEPVFLTNDTAIENFIIDNDRVLEVNNQKVNSFSQVAEYTIDNKENSYTILRNNEEIKLSKKTNKLYFYTSLKPKIKAIIGEVMPGFPAYTAGLKANDEIVKIDSSKVANWYQMQKIIANSKKNSLLLTVKRENDFLQIPINVSENFYEENKKMIGISVKLPVKVEENYSFFESIKNGVIYSGVFIYGNYKALVSLISKPKLIKNSIGGPVMIYTMSSNSVQKGFSATVSLFASLSLILMVMNLLPIPVLDGGQIMFCLIEGILRKPLSFEVQANLQKIGFLLLMGLMFFAFFNDFGKLFKRVTSSKNYKAVSGETKWKIKWAF